MIMLDRLKKLMVPVIPAWILTAFAIYQLEEYGLLVFVCIPFLIGFGSTWMHKSMPVLNYRQAIWPGIMALAIYGMGLILLAIEGLICIAMAFPLAAIISVLGSVLAFVFIENTKKGNGFFLLLALAVFPLASWNDIQFQPPVYKVTTSVKVDASIEKVWEQVIAFPTIEKPEAFLFKTGISYPTHATLSDTGVGAIRECHFSTGKFVEPITHWERPCLLAFSVVKNPPPMKELAFWDIDAPHLHDYFVSEKGQFQLTQLEDGTVLLEGTTWYRHDIQPAFYWKWWSDYIIHDIHFRVLNHIKQTTEHLKYKL